MSKSTPPLTKNTIPQRGPTPNKKAPLKIPVEQAIHMLTTHITKQNNDHNAKFNDIECKLGELTEGINGCTPDVDAFVKTLQTMNAKTNDYEKRIAKLEAALSIQAPPSKKRGGTIKVEPIQLEPEEENICFS